MRRRLWNKLREADGASIVFALVVFLIMTVISVTIVNVALSNLLRIRSAREAEQNYLTVVAAATELEACLQNKRAVLSVTISGTDGSYTYAAVSAEDAAIDDTERFDAAFLGTGLTGFAGQVAKAAVQEAAEGKVSAAPAEVVYTVSVDASSLAANPFQDVAAALTYDADYAQVKAAMKIATPGTSKAGDYQINMYFDVYATESTVQPAPSTGENADTVVYYDVFWGDANIVPVRSA